MKKIFIWFIIFLFFLTSVYSNQKEITKIDTINDKLNVLFLKLENKDITNKQKIYILNKLLKNLKSNSKNKKYKINLKYLKYINNKILDKLDFYIDLDKQIIHIKTPKIVKSLYYNFSAIQSSSKYKNLLEIIEKTDINSVTIDIKTVEWYLYIDIWEDKFSKIKPFISKYKIKNIKDIIKDLHEKWVYVIARMTIFKDNYLSKKRPDLSLKTLKWNIWQDFKWKRYLDPYAKEVWDYNYKIALEAYKLWFDEINLDYIRFPTDGKLSNIYYPFSNKILKDNYKWGKIIIIDEFSNFITSKLKSNYPNIKVSADVFWLVTKINLFNIWQNLESFLINFDYVGPMIYPSHYALNYKWFAIPDNYPYEILKWEVWEWIKKINDLNKLIKKTKSWTWEIIKLKLNPYFSFNKELNKIEIIKKEKLRPWIQWFTCTRCKWATIYNAKKFKKEILWIEANSLKSRFLWKSSSNYDIKWFINKKDY